MHIIVNVKKTSDFSVDLVSSDCLLAYEKVVLLCEEQSVADEVGEILSENNVPNPANAVGLGSVSVAAFNYNWNYWNRVTLFRNYS